jgi:hypothetical protein
MRTSVEAFAATAAAAEDKAPAGSPTQLTESETDHVAGGAPKTEVGNAWGAGQGLRFAGRGGGNGRGAENNNDNGRF